MQNPICHSVRQEGKLNFNFHQQHLELLKLFKVVSSFSSFSPPPLPHCTISLFIHTMASPFGVFNSCQYYVINCRIDTCTAMFLLPLDAVQDVLSDAHKHFANTRILRLIEHFKTIKSSIMYRLFKLCCLPLLDITFCLHFTIKCYVDLTFLDIKSLLYLLFSSGRKPIQQKLFILFYYASYLNYPLLFDFFSNVLHTENRRFGFIIFFTAPCARSSTEVARAEYRLPVSSHSYILYYIF